MNVLKARRYRTETERESRDYILCPDSLAIEADFGEESQIKDMVHRVRQNFGRIDILVNNASVMGSTKSAIEMITPKPI